MIDPLVARKTWRTVEPIHGMIYFVPEAPERYEKLGITDVRSGYFASRSAALGDVPVEVVIATFFNFRPALVRKAMEGVWAITDPASVLAARTDAAGAALTRAWGQRAASDEIVEAAQLARQAAESACEHLEGRPLFAAHAALPWPDAPHQVLWHAQMLLREHRGDGHIGALVAEGVTAVEALVLHAASGEVPVQFLRASRGWPDADWDAAAERLRERGLVAEAAAGESESERGLTLTDEGRAFRQSIEDRTDASSAPAYDVLGDDGCARLRELARPFSKALVEGGFTLPNPARSDRP